MGDNIVAMLVSPHPELAVDTLQLSLLKPGFRAEPGVRVAGAGNPRMNGWYRRMEIDAEPPAEWAGGEEWWYEHVKASPGWYQSVSNDSYIYKNDYCWLMEDEDVKIVYVRTDGGTAPDFPPRDGWMVYRYNANPDYPP